MINIFLVPTFYAHIINGLFLLAAIILLFINYGYIKRVDVYKKIMLLLVFSLCIGIHGISHMVLDKYYNYNPILYLY